jgi:hypothetical protein
MLWRRISGALFLLSVNAGNRQKAVTMKVYRIGLPEA